MAASADPRRIPLFSLSLLVACVALAVLVVILSRQNRELKAELAAADGALRRAQDALKPGERLGPVTAVDGAGREVTVPLDGGGRRLLLVASTRCHLCETVRPYWRELGQRASTSHVETWCLLTDGLPTGEESGALAMPVLGVRGFRGSSIAKLPTVPAVLLLRDGVVEHIWPGPFDGEGRDEIITALGAG